MTSEVRHARMRTRWSAVGAAVAITLGAGGIGLAQAAVGTGDKPVTITIEAERILDTRDNLGLTGAFASETPRDLQVTGDVDVASGPAQKTVVPDGASAVIVNVTAVNPSGDGFVSLRPGGATGAPSTSTVNFGPGTVEPNAATVDLSADGKIQIYAFILGAAPSVHVLIDVVGYTIDHHHDDRYYTQEETDAGNLWAVIAADGDIIRGSNVVDSVNESTGTYRVNFNTDVSECVHLGSDGHGATGFPSGVLVGTATNGDNDNGLYVEVRDDAGALTNANFHVLVQCAPSTGVIAAPTLTEGASNG